MPISPSNRYPRVFLSVLFGFGPQATGAAPRNIVITGYRKIVGIGQATVADNTLLGPILSTDEAAQNWGFGGEIFQGIDAALDQNTDVTLWGVSYAEAAGGNFAEQTLTITGPAVNGGSLLLFIQGNPSFVEVPVTAGMTANDQATAVYNEMLKHKELPAFVPTAPTANLVVFRWNHKGARGNLMAIRFVADGITGTIYGIAPTNVGTTDTDPSPALDALAAFRAAFIVCPDNTGSSSVGIPRFVQYANQRADPITGLRGIIAAAHTGTLAQATAVSTLVNAHRCTLAWCKKAEDPPIRIAARYAVYLVKGTDLDIAANLINGEFRNFRGPVLNADRITEAEATAALNVGLTPIRTYPSQPTVGIVTRPITTRFQDITGNPDYACLNISCVFVPDDFANELELDVPRTFKGWKLAPDDPDEPNEEPLPMVLTPRIFDDYLFDKLRQRAAAAQIVRVEASIAQGAIRSQIHPANPDRILTPAIPMQVIGWFAQWEGTIKQTTKAA
jgi:phage tail sheath gpL-like